MAGDSDKAGALIARWKGVTASELSVAQTFTLDLCDLLGVDRPHATADQDYMFERPVVFQHGDGSTSAGRIDCYKRGHFVLESKKLEAGIEIEPDEDEPPAPAQAAAPVERRPWPSGLPEQIKAVAGVLSSTGQPIGVDTIAEHFKARGRWRDRLPTILDTLEALGRVRKVDGERWSHSPGDRG